MTLTGGLSKLSPAVSTG